MKRSDNIKKAWAYLLQGQEDPMWNFEEWNDYYHDAIDSISEDIVCADLLFYLVRNESVARDMTQPTQGVYQLPVSMRALQRVQLTMNPTGCDGDIYPIRNKIHDHDGYELVNGSLVLTNWNKAIPDVILIDYVQYQPDMGEWDGSDDVLQSGLDDPSKIPLPPLNTPRGARLIARVMNIFAQSKGEDLTQEQASIAKSLISSFVDKIGGSMDETQEQVIGT